MPVSQTKSAAMPSVTKALVDPFVTGPMIEHDQTPRGMGLRHTPATDFRPIATCLTPAPVHMGSRLPRCRTFAEPAGKLLFGEHSENLVFWVALALLLDKAFSVFLFLIGLALRHLFKMK